MELFKKILAYAIFSLQILLVFVLIFESRIEAPVWLQSFGRLHPLLLHLPIGLLLLTAILIFTRKYFESPSFNDLITFLLYLTSFTASLSAFMGILLSLEGGYTEDLIIHKWLGVALSFLCWWLVSLVGNPNVLKPSIAIGVIVLIFTGHFGANLTHGENFVFGPLQKEKTITRVLTDSSTLFSATIQPIFETKCLSCHSESKAKGKLILTSIEEILKGGKNGVLWKIGDPHHSLIVARLSLPLGAKEHMPPKDKTQLMEDEIIFISQWIEAGADMKIKLKNLKEDDTLKKLFIGIIERYHQAEAIESKYHFAFASQEKIQELSTPYRSVFQISQNEPALQAEFYLAGSYETKSLEELKSVKDQLVLLNLSKMPVVDDDLKTISQFPNLEKLILNSTQINGEGLRHLSGLEHLNSLSLSGTSVNVKSLAVLGTNPKLKEIFLWNTKVSKDDIAGLNSQFKNIHWEIGYQPDENEKLRLSPPILRNDEQILKPGENVSLRHNLPGTTIRYTLDGSKPDSVKSSVYNEPIVVSNYSILKTKAYKDGWLSSNPVEFVFFKKGNLVTRSELISQPDKKYPGNGVTTLIDGKLGMSDFYRDPAWIGFRNEPLEAYFFFKETTPTISSITLSYARNIYAMCMPPAELAVWGGKDPKNLKLLNMIKPDQPTEYLSTRVEGVTIKIPSTTFACYKIIAKPLSKLPEFRKEKKEKGWLMVDEVFFN